MMFRRNWLGETSKQEHERRIQALEVHINDLEDRFHQLGNSFLLHNSTHIHRDDIVSVEQKVITNDDDSTNDGRDHASEERGNDDRGSGGSVPPASADQ